VENEQRIRQAARNIRKFLEAHGVKPKTEPKSKADVTPVRPAQKAAG
jgi:hypothetical protein